MVRPLTRCSIAVVALLLALVAQAHAGVVHVVDVGPLVSFSQADIIIQVGDTVRWEWKGLLMHNVESGVGAVHDGNFRSGLPIFGPNIFQVTFDQAFLNAQPMPDNVYPYYCLTHIVFDNMVGSVTVTNSPPGVPDGSNGAAMTVVPLDAFASTLSISWDTTTCAGATDYQIIFGGGSQLPTTPGGVYGLSGSKCSIGTLSPFTWTLSPDPLIDPTGLIWWVVVATDASTTEGSWGKDSANAERSGPGAGGVSGECSITSKNVTNQCGQ